MFNISVPLYCSFQVIKKMNLLVPIRSVSLARGNTHIFVCLQDGKLIVIGVESSWRQPRHRMSRDARDVTQYGKLIIIGGEFSRRQCRH